MSEVTAAPSATTGAPGTTTQTTAPSGPTTGGMSAGTTAVPVEWTSALPEELRGYAQNKGWKDPGTAIDSYRNLEKLMGVPKEQLLRLPKDESTPEEWAPVYERLGRPSKPEEYQIPVPKDGDPELAKWSEKLFHEQGLSRKQAVAIAEKWNEKVGGMLQQNVEAHNNQVLEQETALKKEWGKAFEQNVEIGKRAAREFGLDKATIDKLETALGFSGVLKFMHSVGSKMGEHSFVPGTGRSEFGGSDRMLTPEAARDRIASLRHDSDFVKRYTAGDVNASAEFKRLHEMAYPE